MKPNDHVLRYLALAYACSWSVSGIGIALGVRADSGFSYMVVAGIAMLGPALAAIVLQRWVDRAPFAELGLRLPGTRWPIVVLTALLGMLILPTTLLVQEAMGDGAGIAAFGTVNMSSDAMIANVRELAGDTLPAASLERQLGLLERFPPVLILVMVLLASVLGAVSFNLPFMLGEELGWRGYLWHHLSHWTGLQRVLFTGVVWGFWHAPMIAVGHNYPGHPIAGIGMMVLLCLSMSVLFDWTRTHSGSVWSSALLHGIINGSAGASLLFAHGGHPLVGSVAGLAGVLALLVMGAAVLLLDARYRRRFFHAPEEAQPSTTTISWSSQRTT
ncbi:MAG: CPBP family intramembrane glutamic endopeptidase [Flavobacteriales bacterium]